MAGKHQDEGGWTYRADDIGNNIIETEDPLDKMFPQKFKDLGPAVEAEPPKKSSRTKQPEPDPEEEPEEDGEEDGQNTASGAPESVESPEEGDDEGSEDDEAIIAEYRRLKKNEEVRPVHKGRGRWEIEVVRDGIPTGVTLNEQFLQKQKAKADAKALNATEREPIKED